LPAWLWRPAGPLQVWLGAAGAFVVHVAIATTIGVALFDILPRRALDGVVADMFLFGAVYAWLLGAKQEGDPAQKDHRGSARRAAIYSTYLAVR
jgi:putative Ca2+/H+ antiporter (TMEM165/GDT1 family)